MITGGVDTGWTFYPPYSTAYSTSQVIATGLGVFVSGFSSILTGLNFIVTVHKMRAPGLTWFRMPLFVWAHYATAIIQVLGTPVVAVTVLMIAVERTLHLVQLLSGWHQDDPGGSLWSTQNATMLLLNPGAGSCLTISGLLPPSIRKGQNTLAVKCDGHPLGVVRNCSRQTVEFGFRSLAAKALSVSGAHRCANAAAANCGGTTIACGQVGPYRESDVAHATLTIFQATHQALAPSSGESLTLQLQGNSLTTCPDLFISNGSTQPGEISRALYQEMRTSSELITFVLDHVRRYNLGANTGVVFLCDL